MEPVKKVLWRPWNTVKVWWILGGRADADIARNVSSDLPENVKCLPQLMLWWCWSWDTVLDREQITVSCLKTWSWRITWPSQQAPWLWGPRWALLKLSRHKENIRHVVRRWDRILPSSGSLASVTMLSHSSFAFFYFCNIDNWCCQYSSMHYLQFMNVFVVKESRHNVSDEFTE